MTKRHLGPLIRQIRLARGIAINELARRAGMAGRHCNLSRYERAKKNSLRAPDCLYPISEVLNTSVPALFVLQEMCCNEPGLLENQAELVNRLDRINRGIVRLTRIAA